MEFTYRILEKVEIWRRNSITIKADSEEEALEQLKANKFDEPTTEFIEYYFDAEEKILERDWESIELVEDEDEDNEIYIQ